MPIKSDPMECTVQHRTIIRSSILHLNINNLKHRISYEIEKELSPHLLTEPTLQPFVVLITCIFVLLQFFFNNNCSLKSIMIS